MSTSANGRVIDENGTGLSGLDVHLEDVSRVRVVSLAKATTNSAGQFSLTYADDFTVSNEPGKQIRQLRLCILVGQHVIKEVVQPDSMQPTLTFATIQRNADEATSWWATLGTGAASRVSHSNAIRWLVDNEDAWGHTQDVISRAQTLDIMQLSIELDEYSLYLHTEKPRIVLQFDPTSPLTATNRRQIDDDDKRIERSILARVQQGVDVRIQMPRMRVDRHGLFTIGGITTLAAITGIGALMILGGVIGVIVFVVIELVALVGLILGVLLFYVDCRVFPDQFGRKRVARWFDRAIADLQSAPPTTPPAHALGQVRVTELRLRSNNVTHAKLVIDRGVEAVVLGSPFGQDYFNDPQHLFDDPRRGRSAAKAPIHEMSVAVRGGAVGHLEEVFNNHWNIAEPTDQLPETPPIPSAPTSLKPDEFLASVQVVRTFDQLFAPATNGEKGVLEAYLRAIHFAERFIYFENQYFNNDTLTQALIDALKRKPDLQMILLLNATPDMPLYIGWQQKAITRILESLGDAATANSRVGVFSLWTHASAQSIGSSKPAILDTYLHTKSALIDNRWATVGSANLDGASLDFIQYMRPFLDGDVRNTEANLVVFEDAGTIVSAVDALRRKLWAEHLGFASPQDPALNDAPGKDWVKVWRDLAIAKANKLKADLNDVHPSRILEWPTSPYEEDVKLRKRHHNHALALPYLKAVLRKEVPKDVVAEGGPGSYEFTYGAFPNPDLPGSERVRTETPTSVPGPADISDEAATT